MEYSPEPLSRANEAHKTAKDFARLFRHVLLRTVVRAVHIPLVPTQPARKKDWTRTTWTVGAIDEIKVPRATELTDGTWLVAAQTLGIRESRRGTGLWLTTLKYIYSWQATDDDKSWIIRWDYDRDRTDGRPLSHVHVNAQPGNHDGEQVFHRLHIPGGRIGVEDVVAFLLRERGVPAIDTEADEIVAEARQIFAVILGRPWPPVLPPYGHE